MTPTFLLLLALPLLARAEEYPVACRTLSGETHSSCLEQRGQTMFVKTSVLRGLSFTGGLAPLWSKNWRWMYVNKRGKVVIEGVTKTDNGPDPFQEGLVRVERGGKCGFADQKGTHRVPAVYDGCLGFEHGKARVCVKCKLECAEKECEHHEYKGGDWRCVGPWGARVACPPLP